MSKNNDEFKELIEKMSTEELMKILVDKMRKEDLEMNNTEEKSETKQIKNALEEENLYSGYLKGFDEEYQTQMQDRIKKTPMLINILESMDSELHRPSKLYKIASKARERIEEDLSCEMSKNSKKLLEQLKYCDEVILFDAMRDAFIYGYAISIQMKEETEKKDKKRSKYFLSSLDNELYLFMISASLILFELRCFKGVGISVRPRR